MSNLGWLDVDNIDFNALLLLEPLHVQYIAAREPDKAMGTALNANLAVAWYLRQTHPPIDDYAQKCLALAEKDPTQAEIRQAEITVLEGMQDWLIYVLNPAQYDQLEFLDWDDQSLLEITKFEDKTVLDIGSGTGRLAFTVAPLAKVFYAVEPVANLRWYLWKKREALDFNNVFPIDGSTTRIPFPSDFADILMAGHVFGNAPEEEYEEFLRVTRAGGKIIFHPGSNASSEDHIHRFLIKEGFSWDTFVEPGEGEKRKYWKTIHKENLHKENSSC